MCLIALYHDPDGPVPLRLIANRDEFHARPTAPLAEWPDLEGVIGGRDLQAGGSWLAVHRRGRVAALTNVRDPDFHNMRSQATGLAADTISPSRGHLVTTALTTDDPRSWLEQLANGDALAYAGFNLLLADGKKLWHLHRSREGLRLSILTPGVHALSNADLDTPWPKLINVRQALTHSLDHGEWPTRALAAFADTHTATDAELPDTGIGTELERRLSAAFILGQDYGTRATTHLEWRANGQLDIQEHSYGPNGARIAVQRFSTTTEHL